MKGLAKARRLFRRRRFTAVIALLEPQVFMYRENAAFFYLLGVSCLYTGDYGGAHSYLRRSLQLTDEDTNALLGLAAVHLKRRENQDALRLWLDVLDRHPKNRIARRGLTLLQKTDDPVRLSEELTDGRMQRFFPSPGFSLPVWVPVVAGILAIGTAGWLWGEQALEAVTDRLEERRPGYEVLEVTNQPDRLTEAQGDFRYILTAEEIEDTYQRIARLFNTFRDNLALREINRILLSNAADSLKERVRLLRSYTEEPDFTNFEDGFRYDEVASEPWLYDNCFVRWKGRATNVEVTDSAILFDFLVGYHTDEVLEGIVPARITFSTRVEPGDPLEVIARVQYAGSTMSLLVTSVRRLAPGGDS